MVYCYYCLLSKILDLCVHCSLFSHFSSQQFPRFPLPLISLPPPLLLHHLAIASHVFQAEARTIGLLKSLRGFIVKILIVDILTIIVIYHKGGNRRIRSPSVVCTHHFLATYFSTK